MKPRMNFYQAAPDTIKALTALEAQIQASGLEKSLIELVKTRASQINGCAFCINMHTADARKQGETEQRLYLLNAWRESPLYTDRERAALAWTEAVTLIAETHAPDYDLHHFWNHQIRWNRTVRDARPAGYAGMIFTFAIFWALVTMGLARGAWWSVDLFATVLFCRYLMAFVAGQIVLGDRYVLRDLWLLWVRDVFGWLVWITSYFGRTIVWRGEKFVLSKGVIRPA